MRLDYAVLGVFFCFGSVSTAFSPVNVKCGSFVNISISLSRKMISFAILNVQLRKIYKQNEVNK